MRYEKAGDRDVASSSPIVFMLNESENVDEIITGEYEAF